jgi:uncharacterized protein (TIGR03066 family)
MIFLRSLALIALICCMSAAAVNAQEKNAKLLLGTWVVTKSAGAGSMPEGTIVEFGAGGKLKLTVDIKGKELVINANYTVEGDKFTIIEKKGTETRMQAVKIKKITGDQLITENEQGKEVELKRKK